MYLPGEYVGAIYKKRAGPILVDSIDFLLFGVFHLTIPSMLESFFAKKGRWYAQNGTDSWNTKMEYSGRHQSRKCSLFHGG